MPYKTLNLLLPAHLDRRRKLSDEDRVSIINLSRMGWSQRKLAAKFGVSRRLIMFTINPAQAQRNKDIHHPKKYTRDEWSSIMREHRAYKHRILGGLTREEAQKLPRNNGKFTGYTLRGGETA